MLNANEQRTIESWRQELRREKQLQPRIDGDRLRLAAERFRCLLQSRRTMKVRMA